MAKIFLVISIVITLLTGGLAFVTKGKIDKLNSTLTATRERETALNGDKKRLTAEVKKTTDDLTAANKTVEDQKGQLATAATDLTASKAETAKAKETIDEDAKTLADTKTELDKVKAELVIAQNGPKGPTGAPADPAEITKLKAEVAEAHQVADTLKQRDKESSEKVAQLTKEVTKYRLNVARPGITGRVVAVNPGWNFLVVDVGDRRGAVLNAQLLVTRAGQTVARAKITSVEPSTSIADVIPGTLLRGQSVQPGDSVIFSGRSPAALPVDEAAPAAGAATPAPAVGAVQAEVH